MHVLVDLRWLKPGYTGGIEIAARSFVNTLLQLDTINRYTLLLRPEIRFDFDLEKHPNIQVQVCYGPRYYAVRLLGCIFKRKAPKPGFRRILEQDTDAEVAISLSGYSYADLRDWKNVLVLPDLQHEFLPQFFNEEELSNRKRAFSTSIRRAGHICAISEFTRQRVLELFSIPEERISTIHLAPDPVFKPSSGSEVARDHAVLNKYGLQPGFLYYPAATWPHKNHRLILQAMSTLNEQSILKLILVCTGPHKAAHPDIIRQISVSGLEDQVHFLGYCPFEDLPSLYRQAGVLVFPSYYEGFGMPILEAMACGCPVICSDRTSLPEIAGDAALMINPESVEGLTQAIVRLIETPDLRGDLVQRGLERAKQFSWLKYTHQVVSTACLLSGDCADLPLPKIEDEGKQVPEAGGSCRPSRKMRTRQRVAQALEDRRMGKRVSSFSKLVGAIMTAPGVVFYTVLFPTLRDLLLDIKMQNEYKQSL